MTGRRRGRGGVAQARSDDPAPGPTAAGSGFTLVEVIVAVVLLTVGLLASVSMMSLAARTLGDARRVSLATAAAGSLADSLVAAAGEGASGMREHPWGILRWGPGEGAREVRIVAVAPATGNGADGDAAAEEGAVILELYVRVRPVSSAAGPEG